MKTTIVAMFCCMALFLSCDHPIWDTPYSMEMDQWNSNRERIELWRRENKAKRDFAKFEHERCREKESKILDGFTNVQLEAYVAFEKALGGGSEGLFKLAENRINAVVPAATLQSLLDILTEKERILQEMVALKRESESIEAEFQQLRTELENIETRQTIRSSRSSDYY